jgi:hypothetical protein
MADLLRGPEVAAQEVGKSNRLGSRESVSTRPRGESKSALSFHGTNGQSSSWSLLVSGLGEKGGVKLVVVMERVRMVWDGMGSQFTNRRKGGDRTGETLKTWECKNPLGSSVLPSF